jgi:hypothetical protein
MFLPPGYKYFLKFEEDSSVLMHKSLTYWNAFDPAYCAICNHEGLGKVQQIHKWTMMDLVMDREWWDLWRSTLNELHSGYMNDEFTWETPGVQGAGGGGRAEAWTIREGCRLKGSALERRRGSNLRSGTNMMLQLETQKQRRKLVPQGDPGAKEQDLLHTARVPWVPQGISCLSGVRGHRRRSGLCHSPGPRSERLTESLWTQRVWKSHLFQRVLRPRVQGRQEQGEGRSYQNQRLKTSHHLNLHCSLLLSPLRQSHHRWSHLHLLQLLAG